VVCFWHFEGDCEQLARRLRLAEGDTIVTTLPAALAIVNAHRDDETTQAAAEPRPPVQVAEPTAPHKE